MSENPDISTPERVEIDYMERFLQCIQSLPQEEEPNLLPLDVPKVNSYSDILPHKTKSFGNVTKQLASLEKWCKIPDRDKAYSNPDFRKHKLAEIKYFRLKGYISTLLNVRKKGISFETVCRVYDCDAQLRELLLRVLQRIEISLRAQLSNFHARRHQPYGYLNKNIYAYPYPQHSHSEFLTRLAEMVKRNEKNPFVEHYLKNYDGIMPIWVVSELMSFGDLVNFYKNWTQKDRLDFLSKVQYKKRTRRLNIAKEDGERFITWLDACRKLRNVCAHCGQLYGRFFPWTPNLPRGRFTMPDGESLSFTIPDGGSLPVWASVLAAEFLYPDETEWKTLVVKNLRMILNSVPKADLWVLRAGLGFPETWEKELDIWWSL